MFAAVIKDIVAHTGAKHLEHFGKNFTGLLRIDTETSDLVRRYNAADTEFDTPAGKMIEHAHFFDQAQRMVKRQQKRHRRKANTRGALSEGRKNNVGDGAIPNGVL